MGQIVQGPWGGPDGLAGLEQGTDFNCTSTICYGVTKSGEQAPGAVHQTFVNLQRAINRWSGKAQFTPVTADGKIGQATVEALQKAAAAALDTLPVQVKTIAKNLFAGSLTKENVAANAATLTESLTKYADSLEAQGALPAPLPAPTTSSAPPAATTTSSSPGTALQPSSGPATGSKSSLIWWLLGGFAVVATAGIATAVVLKRRRRKDGPSSRAHAGRSAHAY